MGSLPRTILVADDDKFIRDDISHALKDLGHRLVYAATAVEVLSKVKSDRPDLVLLDIKFPDSQDLGPLKRIKSELPKCEVIIISSQSENVSQVVEAIKLGAYDYVPKPFIKAELINRVQNALSLGQYRTTQDRLIREIQSQFGLDSLIGESPAMTQVRDTILRFADMDGCVLIRGESGTGKELAARALHYQGKRRANPFVVVNCAAIPESLVESVLFGHKKGAFTGAVDDSKGRFEVAANGTMFLDEIGDMPLPQQASLLRVLEYRKFTPVGESSERECRARFVFATNRDLRELVKENQFRQDLFYRINVAAVSMPPLRTRPEDIPTLVEHYSMQLASQMGRSPLRLSPDVLEVLQKYDWPGNVRELRNIVESALMMSLPKETDFTLQHLPTEFLALRPEEFRRSAAESVERIEKSRLLEAVHASGGNISGAARILNCHRNTVRSRLRYFGISDLTAAKGSKHDQ